MRRDVFRPWGRGLSLCFQMCAGASPARSPAPASPARAPPSSPAGHVAHAASGAPKGGSRAPPVFQVKGAAPIGLCNSRSVWSGSATVINPRNVPDRGSETSVSASGSKRATGPRPDLDGSEALLCGLGPGAGRGLPAGRGSPSWAPRERRSPRPGRPGSPPAAE